MRKFLLRISISLALVIYFAVTARWKEIGEIFKSIDVSIYVLSTVVGSLASFVLAAKYWVLIRKTLLDTSLLRLTVINYISTFYALFFPTPVSQHVVRWFKVTRNKNGRVFFLSNTIVERLYLLLLLLCCGGIPLALSSSPEIAQIRRIVLPLVTFAFMCTIFSLFYFHYAPIREKLNKVLQRVIRLDSGSRVMAFLKEFNSITISPSKSFSLTALSIIWQFVFISRLFLLFQAIHVPFGFWDVAWMGSLVLLLQTLPVSFAGLGLREGAYGFLFSQYHLPSEKGIAVGLLFFTQMLIYSFAGAILSLFEKKE